MDRHVMDMYLYVHFVFTELCKKIVVKGCVSCGFNHANLLQRFFLKAEYSV